VISVIGCGNLNRSDDGVGVAVIRALRRLDQRQDVKLFDAGTDGMSVMFAARGSSTLIVIDCCSTGSPAGAVFEVPGSELSSAHVPSLNLHDFRWQHALHAGRQIFRESFPKDVVILLVEARTVALGIGLSAEVEAASAKVCTRIGALISERPAP
jgi:hydrogenase maturation protease